MTDAAGGGPPLDVLAHPTVDSAGSFVTVTGLTCGGPLFGKTAPLAAARAWQERTGDHRRRPAT